MEFNNSTNNDTSNEEWKADCRHIHKEQIVTDGTPNKEQIVTDDTHSKL